MKRTILTILFLTISLSGVSQLRLWVAPNGNDRASGSETRPLRTIQRAVDLAASVADSSIDIVLHGGDYSLDKSVEICDSSFLSKHLTISAAPGQKVSVNGAISINPLKVKTVTDPILLQRMAEQSRSKVRVIDLSGSDIPLTGLHCSGFGRPSVAAWSEIFVNDSSMQLARWPNDSMALIGKIIVGGNEKDKAEGRLPIFQCNTSRLSQWTQAKDMWISGYFGHGYADDMVAVKSINPEDSTISAAQFTTYEFLTGAPFRQWFALNLIEEIDQRGEYVLDIQNRKIYFYPPSEAIETIKLSVLENPLFIIEHTANVTLRGLILECSRGMGVYMAGTENVVVESCLLRNLGNVGVCMGQGTLSVPNTTVKPHSMEAGGTVVRGQVGDVMGKLYQDVLYFRNGGHRNGVRNCIIDNVGAGGVNMSGGNRITLERGENFVENCRITNYNRIEKSYRPAVWIDGVGNRISRLDISEAPSMAIILHGNDHLVELCRITNVCHEVDDQGAIYYGRDPSERGIVIRYCFFKDLSPRHRVTATYHDDGACAAELYGNIYLRAGSMPVLIGGGHDNVYRNNIFMFSPLAIHIDNRMQGWGANMVAKDGIIEQRLHAVCHTCPPYSTAYPALVNYLIENPAQPKRNIFEGNLFYKVNKVLDGQSSWGEWWNNWATNTDPGFVDENQPLKGFRSDAPIFKYIEGFPEIPFSKIGCDL
ncbi:MAG: right-handed parallel beta-helix repeat-containing protein [Mucinivorans sp.]